MDLGLGGAMAGTGAELWGVMQMMALLNVVSSATKVRQERREGGKGWERAFCRAGGICGLKAGEGNDRDRC